VIRRLVNLTLQDFRCYQASTSIPLDADVIVIYGPNGSGKTSFFSALEFALTGAVTHLAAFTSDYPRSLQHVRSKEPGSVSLSYRSVNNQECRVDRRLAAASSPIGQQLTRADVRFYRERCYLSQHQMSRFFETYGDGDKKDVDQPLVRFARDLLSLDSLENITEGLHVVQDKRRMDNASEPYRRLREERDRLPAARKRLMDEIKGLEDVFARAIAKLETFFDHGISPHGHVEWTEASIRSRRSAVESERISANRRERISELQRSQGSLETAIRVLEKAPLGSSGDKAKLTEQLVGVQKEIEARRQTLLPILTAFERTLARSFPNLAQRIDAREFEPRLDGFEAAARRALGSVQTSLKAAEDLRTRLSEVVGQRQTLQQQRELSVAGSASDSTGPKELLDALISIARHVHDETCPVCARDYSELRTGPLRRRLELEVERLGGDVRRLTELASQKAKLDAELVQLSGSISALQEQVEKQEPLTANYRSSEVELTRVLTDLASLATERAQLTTSIKTAAELSQRIAGLDNTQKQATEISVQVSAIGAALNVPRGPELKDWCRAITESVRTQIDELTNQDRRASGLIEALDTAEKTAVDLKNAKAQLPAFEARSKELDESWKRVEECIKEAKALATAATNAKQILLDEVFAGPLNDLWRDLFRRLVKSDRFTPQLKLERHARQLRLQIEGRTDGTDPFDHAGSVLSAGNFNTAALSLFLSVHLLEQPKHQLLVLDDPVQNIDDLHVVQLASLLRTIVFGSNRQLIVGVHEKALFDYLCLELGPTNAGQTLLAIEVVGGADTKGAEVRSEFRRWENDKLQLGA
jgi:exonuclease SbcC